MHENKMKKSGKGNTYRMEKMMLAKTIDSKWKITEIIGQGTFSIVYRCYHIVDEEFYAFKYCKDPKFNSFLDREVMFYNDARKKGMHHNFPKTYGRGTQNGKQYLVMEEMGASLEEQLRQLQRQMAFETVFQFGIKAIYLLRKVHELGYIYRDVKPQNFVILGNDNLFLLDFGLVKPYVTADGDQIFVDTPSSFVGTPRFASIRAHQGQELSRKDDLESLGYMLVYLMKGRLPWQGITQLNMEERLESIQCLKTVERKYLCRIEYKDEFSYLNIPMMRYFREVDSLRCEDQPDYDFLQFILMDGIEDMKELSLKSYHHRFMSGAAIFQLRQEIKSRLQEEKRSKKQPNSQTKIEPVKQEEKEDYVDPEELIIRIPS